MFVKSSLQIVSAEAVPDDSEGKPGKGVATLRVPESSLTDQESLIAVIQGLGLAATTAVGLSSMMGIAQVGSRSLELIGQRWLAPLTVGVISLGLLPLSLLIMLAAGGDPLLIAGAALLCGAGNGLVTVVRGAVPLALFGHAGYAGTLGRIAENTVHKMKTVFDTTPKDILVGISPSIGWCHFDVGRDVADKFHRTFGADADQYTTEDPDGTVRLDLSEANRIQLLAAGVSEDHIQTSGFCTACHPESFYSHRRDKGRTGRFAAIIMLRVTGNRAY